MEFQTRNKTGQVQCSGIAIHRGLAAMSSAGVVELTRVHAQRTAQISLDSGAITIHSKNWAFLYLDALVCLRRAMIQ